ncbi:helix-turn-helix domain-containing protein [Vibrio parahaemolyticus]|uniref:helix-turn-helix domain-containing protein n=1 Tax=Vibrio parahaemolyticus TaxID=670 RepID=UPI003133C0D5
MLASIAEFENDLRTERQAEGIAKAKENGVKFGRPAKLNEQISDAIHSRRTEGATIGQLAKEFELGEATIYRALKIAMTKENEPHTPPDENRYSLNLNYPFRGYVEHEILLNARDHR